MNQDWSANDVYDSSASREIKKLNERIDRLEKTIQTIILVMTTIQNQETKDV